MKSTLTEQRERKAKLKFIILISVQERGSVIATGTMITPSEQKVWFNFL